MDWLLASYWTLDKKPTMKRAYSEVFTLALKMLMLKEAWTPEAIPLPFIYIPDNF